MAKERAPRRSRAPGKFSRFHLIFTDLRAIWGPKRRILELFSVIFIVFSSFFHAKSEAKARHQEGVEDVHELQPLVRIPIPSVVQHVDPHQHVHLKLFHTAFKGALNFKGEFHPNISKSSSKASFLREIHVIMSSLKILDKGIWVEMA